MPLPESYLPPPVPDALEGLAELALDFGLTSFAGARALWAALEPEVWAATRNPWLVLQLVEDRRLAALAGDAAFVARFRAAVEAYRERLSAPGWLPRAHPQAELPGVAYFSMEFGLSDALPIYSGGLGNVAGDQLKAASDLDVPVVGIGLLYQTGYFRQDIGRDGWQRELHPYNDPVQLPVLPVRDRDGGEWLRVALDLPGRRLWLRAWEARVGRVRLYLLDSNELTNTPADRGITSELYGGDPELRLLQEIALGIGGWRLLGRLGLRPAVCHLNEGHAAFAVLERAREFMTEAGVPFATALTVTRAGNLFTTHTPVAAGFDRFPVTLVERQLSRYAHGLGIGIPGLMALGRAEPGDPGEPLNMAYLAVRGSAAVNGVSALHGAVSRRIFAPLFPRRPVAEVPVGHVTNGVHTQSWLSTRAGDLWRNACGEWPWDDPCGAPVEALSRVPEEELWALRSESRHALVHQARARLGEHLAASGASDEEVARAGECLDPNVLTLGFARRFATYKRPNLLLHDTTRLTRILTDMRRPVQVVIAGKAHPHDDPGKAMLREWLAFVRRPEVRPRAVFLPDYDITLARHLVQGVDVWLNTPRRPWEASGTSGMKVLANGGLNLSELDGWWAEAWTREVGWSLGDGQEHGDDPAWDAAEAGALYDLLEREVVPCFYERDARGVPRRWVRRMRASMARLTPRFGSSRVVREYAERHYLPLAEAYARRAADKGRLGAELRRWLDSVERHWASLHFGDVRVERVGERHHFHVQAYLGDLRPDGVRVELYADGSGGSGPEVHAMERTHALPGAVNGHSYEARVPAARPAGDYTPRLVPHHPGVHVPLEAPQILWQH
jgi:starch phosphorylase